MGCSDLRSKGVIHLPVFCGWLQRDMDEVAIIDDTAILPSRLYQHHTMVVTQLASRLFLKTTLRNYCPEQHRAVVLLRISETAREASSGSVYVRRGSMSIQQYKDTHRNTVVAEASRRRRASIRYSTHRIIVA